MPQERVFFAPNLALPPLGDDLAQWLRGRDFDVQQLPVEGDGILIQARQHTGWKTMLGMGLATNVVINRIGPNIRVEAGQGQWLDKAVAGAVGVLLLWPALIPAAIGAWQQSKLPDEVFEHVSAFVARQPQSGAPAQAAQPAQTTAPETVPSPWDAAPAGAAPAETPTVACPHCGQSVHAGSKFCEHCGQPLPQMAPGQPKPRFCANCGAALTPGAKFCPDCGKAA